ncbi:unnamed protein product [Soboliphyme baturini]|uniref:Endo/exonuclease/phosphatase domain-containing protein n=1 Tax=Soboliphyme baturini TaxID=241478 RepID=A0A183INF3_9BILA|nr:unnamed protein product [Soboliphyme baturini]
MTPFLRKCSVLCTNEVPNTESLILMGDFNAHVGADTEKRKYVTGNSGPGDLNNNRMKLLRFCANNELSIMNTFFEHRSVLQYTWSRKLVYQSR